MTTVSTICPCGKTFDREVRRGRPQVWCHECVLIPFADRTRAEIVEGEVVAEGPSRNPLDKFWRNRDAIEAGVVEVNAAYKVAFAELVAAGADPFGDECAALSAEYSDNLKAVYAPFKPDTSKADVEVEE